MHKHRIVCIFILFWGILLLSGGGARSTVESEATGAAELLTLRVTRDAFVSNVGDEAIGNNGGASTLKVKSIQEMSLIDVDVNSLRGHAVDRAELLIRHSGGDVLKRITVGSISSDWVEGNGSGYANVPGSSTFRSKRHPSIAWTTAGGDLTEVILGRGGSLWGSADASPRDERGIQRIPIDPKVVAARVAGLSEGFLIFDDTGSEWTRNGESFNYRVFPNRFFDSREAGRSEGPLIRVNLGKPDSKPPEAPSDVTQHFEELPDGEAAVSWRTPRDEGPSGTLGFFLEIDGKPVPRHLVPLAGPEGALVSARLRDIGLKPGTRVTLRVRATDAAGNIGPPAEIPLSLPRRSRPSLPAPIVSATSASLDLPRLGEAEVAVIDELDKVEATRGAMIPRQNSDYPAENHLWSSSKKEVKLYVGRNEFTAFQVLVKGGRPGIDLRLEFAEPESRGISIGLGRYATVESPRGKLPDPIVPLKNAFGIPVEDSPERRGFYQSFHVELFAPRSIKAGEHRGRLMITDGLNELSINVTLTIWDFTLPNVLSFLPEMNCYNLPVRDERDFYRLGQVHRTALNRVPYYQNGQVAEGYAPAIENDRAVWSSWDRRFGPLFDGSAFADLPRASVPIECFYLPLHENWPTPIAEHYRESYWADQALTKSYRARFVDVSKQFAKHFHEKNWKQTFFECYLNNKVDFKGRGWSRGSSPWLLDEPANFQDYLALRYFGEAFHEGVFTAGTDAKAVFRCDISRPQWRRDVLDGLLDIDVVNSSFRKYQDMVLDEKRREGRILVEYGTTNPVEESNAQSAAWCVDAWCRGADGVLPWQTVGVAGSWRKADTLALFYPSNESLGYGPTPSIRLKAYRRGQQDVEYLALLANVLKRPRWEIGELALGILKLNGRVAGSGGGDREDAGRIRYDRLTPRELWTLRMRVGRALSDARPEPRDPTYELRTPTRDPSRLRRVPYYADKDGERTSL